MWCGDGLMVMNLNIYCIFYLVDMYNNLIEYIYHCSYLSKHV